jgi:ribosome-associated protein
MAKTTGDKTSDRAPKKRTVRAKTDGTAASTPKAKKKPTTVLKAAAKKVASAPRKRPAKKSAETPEAQNVIRQNALQAAQFAIEKKAVNVRLLDLTKITSMTDYFVICHGESDPQVKAIAENVISRMRDDAGVAPWRSEGWDALQWVLIDFVDFVVHVFQTESRQYYNLERLWADAPAITVEDTIAPPKARAKRTAVLPKPDDTAEESPSGVRVISDFNPVQKKKKTRIKPPIEDQEESEDNQ